MNELESVVMLVHFLKSTLASLLYCGIFATHVYGKSLDFLWESIPDNAVGLTSQYETNGKSGAIIVGSHGKIFNLNLETGGKTENKCAYGIAEWDTNSGISIWSHLPTQVSFAKGYLFVQTKDSLQQIDWEGCQDGTDESDIKIVGTNVNFVGMGGHQLSGGMCDHHINNGVILILTCNGELTSREVGSFKKIATGRPLPSSNDFYLSSGKAMKVADAELRLFQLEDHFYITGTTSHPDRYGSKPKLVRFDPQTLSKISEQVITCKSPEIYRPDEYIFVGLTQSEKSFKYIQIKPGFLHNLPVVFSLEDGACLEHTNLSVYDNWDLRVLKLRGNFAFHGSTLYDLQSDKAWSIPSGVLEEQVKKSCSSAFTDVKLFAQDRVITVTCLNYSAGKFELDRIFGFSFPDEMIQGHKRWIEAIKSMFD